MNVGDYVVLKSYEDIQRTADYANFGFNDEMEQYVKQCGLRRITEVYRLGSRDAIALYESDYNWSPEWVQIYMGQELDGLTI